MHEVLRFGRLAAASNGQVAAVVRPAVTVVDLSSAGFPSTWQAAADGSGAVYPAPSGTLETAVPVSATGRYGFWLAGSFRRRLELSVDGRKLATAQHHLNRPGVDTPLGEADLTAGRHRSSFAPARRISARGPAGRRSGSGRSSWSRRRRPPGHIRPAVRRTLPVRPEPRLDRGARTLTGITVVTGRHARRPTARPRVTAPARGRTPRADNRVRDRRDGRSPDAPGRRPQCPRPESRNDARWRDSSGSGTHSRPDTSRRSSKRRLLRPHLHALRQVPDEDLAGSGPGRSYR